MNCEICGRDIIGGPNRVVIDGIKMIVCASCAPMGSSYWEPITPSKNNYSYSKKPVLKQRRASPKLNSLVDTIEPVENLPTLIKKTRIKLGLSQDDLAKKSKEKLSVIQKIELGKLTPNIKLCKTLEHILKVKLLINVTNEELLTKITDQKSELTLGDVIHFKKRKK